jgi:hypothetical protein
MAAPLFDSYRLEYMVEIVHGNFCMEENVFWIRVNLT